MSGAFTRRWTGESEMVTTVSEDCEGEVRWEGKKRTLELYGRVGYPTRAPLGQEEGAAPRP